MQWNVRWENTFSEKHLYKVVNFLNLQIDAFNQKRDLSINNNDFWLPIKQVAEKRREKTE